MDFTPFVLFGIPCLFSQFKGTPRIPHCYEYFLRHGDDDSTPCTLEKSVTVNRFGRVLSFVPLMEADCEYRTIGTEDWGFCDAGDWGVPYDEKGELPSPYYLQRFDVYTATTLWPCYLQYLIDWAQTHSEIRCVGMTPVCFEEFLCNDVVFYTPDHVDSLRKESRSATETLSKGGSTNAGDDIPN